ncbi:MAG: EAL domain-containing protein [Ornithinimicrobium sp.]
MGALGLGSLALPPYADPAIWQAIVLLLGFLVVLGLLGVSLRRTERTWVDPMPAFLFFGLIAVARDLGGGSYTGVEPLVALPILWLAITGTKADLAVAGVLTGTVFILPTIVVGAPQYPASDWRSAALWIGLAVLVAPAVRLLVAQLAQERLRVIEANAAMEAILRASELTSVVSCSTDGTVLSFNSGAEELLGYRAQDVVGKKSALLFHDPQEVAEVASDLGVAPGFAVFVELAEQRTPSRLWTYITADGDRRKAQLVVTGLYNEDGVLYGYIRVSLDVTNSALVERNLAESEARWRALLEHLPNMTVLMLDEDLRIGIAAGQGVHRLGLFGTEGLLLEQYSPQVMALVRTTVERALCGEESGEYIEATMNGAEHEIVVSPLPVGPDEKAQALLVARDVSEEYERARKLQASSKRAERLFADAPHGIALLKPDSTVLRLNQTMRTWLGDGTVAPLSDAAALGQEDVLTVHLEEAVNRQPALVRADWNVLQPDGREIHLSLSSRAVHDMYEDVSDVILVNAVDVSERRMYERRLAHLADHDALTGLANRRKFDEELQRHHSFCQRYGPVGALLLIDLDHFKDVNDTLGHHSGDQLIISTGAVIRAAVRDTDLVARVGGDEFAVLLPVGGREAAMAVGNHLVERVREHTETFDGIRRRVSASIGGVTFVDAQQNGTEILGLADMMMYDAKEAGRDRCLVLDREKYSQPRMSARLDWRRRIERALEHDNFVLFLQPVQDLRTGRVTTAEALLRLNDQDELVPPSKFLYIAEQTGLAPAIDDWVLRHAIGLLEELRLHDPDFCLEVNLSGLSIGDSRIEKTIVEQLQVKGVHPSALILEITETAAVADIAAARAFAQRMTALGCRLALDDFGAGFGSFYYLKHLPFDFVKIDGEFIENCPTSAVDRTILKSIIGIAQGLGKQSIAEFVVDADVLEVVRTAGVDFAQGFEVGKPVLPEEFLDTWLRVKSDAIEGSV